MQYLRPSRLLALGLGAALCGNLPGTGLQAQVSTLSWDPAVQPVPVLTDIRDVAIADTDGDGDGDIIILHASDVAVVQNKGLGFTLKQSIPASAQSFQLRTGDIDGDGDLDLTIADSTGINVWANSGGSFTSVGLVATPAIDGHELGDMNGDGLLDLLFTETASNQFQWYPNDSAGAFAPVADTVLRSATGQTITLIDLEMDGDLDVVATTNSPNTITRYLNPGNGDLSSGMTSVSFIVARDVNGISIDSNSLMDMTSFEANKVVQYVQASVDSFAERRSVAVDVLNPLDLAVGDVDFDGKDDIVASAEGVISYWLASSRGTFSSFEEEELVDSIDQANRILLADFEGDGDPDLWTIAGPERRLYLYKAVNDTCEATDRATNLQVNFTSDSLLLSWDPPAQTVGCRAEGSKVVGSGFRALKQVTGPGPHVSGVRLNALQPSTDYMWRVRCVCSLFPLELGQATPNDTFTAPAPRMAAELPTVPARLLGQDAQRILDWGVSPAGELRWEIIDLTGRVVASGQGTQRQVALDLSGMAAGSYWINAEDGEGRAVLPLALTRR